MVSQDQFHREAKPEVIQKLSQLSYLSPIEKSDYTTRVYTPLWKSA